MPKDRHRRCGSTRERRWFPERCSSTAAAASRSTYIAPRCPWMTDEIEAFKIAYALSASTAATETRCWRPARSPATSSTSTTTVTGTWRWVSDAGRGRRGVQVHQARWPAGIN